MAVVTEDYFSASARRFCAAAPFGLHDNRDRTAGDDCRSTRRPIAIFPARIRSGNAFACTTDDGGRKMRTIVGVVPHLKVYGYDETASPLPQVYLPHVASAADGLVMLLRTSSPRGNPGEAVPANRRVARSGAAGFRSAHDAGTRAETWATPRLMHVSLSAFASLALVLASIGLYGVMAYNGQRRTREIGVRLALGARRRQIVSLMLRQGTRLLAVGLLLGFFSAFALSRLIRSLLFEVNATDPASTSPSACCSAPPPSSLVGFRRDARPESTPMITLRAE